MDDKERTALIYRLASGYTYISLGKHKFVVDTPDIHLFNEAMYIYNDTINTYKYEEFLPAAMTANVLFIHNQWSIIHSEKELKATEESIEAAKLELYNLYGMPQTQIKKTRDHLAKLQSKRNQLLNIKHSLDEYTLDGFAEWTAEMYLFSKLIRDNSFKPLEVDDVTLSYIIKAYKKSLPSMSDYRLLARTDPWRSFWSTNKDCFRILGDEQRMLLILTKMYESVYENQDRPPEDVINDDDMLDGWFLFMREKFKEQQRENAKNILTNKYSKADDIFSFTQDLNEAQEIINMNDVRGKIVQKQIHTAVAQKELVSDMEIPELRLHHMAKQNSKLNEGK